MFRISCFADEISPDLEVQIKTMKELNIKYVELRSVWEKNVLGLTDAEASRLKTIFDKSGIQVSSIGSPIGKVDFDADLGVLLEQMYRAIELAKLFGTHYIRIFSFYLNGQTFESAKLEIIKRLNLLTDIAKRNDIVLLLENEKRLYGERSEHCHELYKAIDSPHFLGVFDPSNYVFAGEEPFECLKRVHRYIEYMHIKDSVRETGEIVYAGEGDGAVEQILDFLRYQDGMFLSIEPHLKPEGLRVGLNSIELFKKDYKALTAILDRLEIAYA